MALLETISFRKGFLETGFIEVGAIGGFIL